MSNNVQDQYGWADTELTDSNHLLLPRIFEMLPASGAKVLDLGCGNGTLSAALSARGHEVVAVDSSEDGINLAKKKFKGVRFEVASIYDEDFCSVVGRDFDYVISMEVVEHLFWPRKLFEAAHAVLKPGGSIVVTTPYHGYIKNLAISILNGWDKHFTVDWDGGHIKFFSRQTLTRMMRGQDFTNIRFKGVGRIAGLWKSMILTGCK